MREKPKNYLYTQKKLTLTYIRKMLPFRVTALFLLLSVLPPVLAATPFSPGRRGTRQHSALTFTSCETTQAQALHQPWF
jgi:hypothetical protein